MMTLKPSTTQPRATQPKKATSTLCTVSALAAVFCMGVSAHSSAYAEVSASFAVSNMYLFRGLNLTTSGSPAVSGSIDWTHDTGLYGTVWTSSEGPSGSYEVDFIAGFANQVGDFSYDLSLISYEYPGATGSEDYGDVSEFILGLGYGGFSFSIADALHGEQTAGDFYYVTLGHEMDKFGAMLGTTISDTADEYTHLDLSFAATEELSFVLSTIVDDGGNDAIDTDPLLSVMWSKSFDID